MKRVFVTSGASYNVDDFVSTTNIQKKHPPEGQWIQSDVICISFVTPMLIWSYLQSFSPIDGPQWPEYSKNSKDFHSCNRIWTKNLMESFNMVVFSGRKYVVRKR